MSSIWICSGVTGDSARRIMSSVQLSCCTDGPLAFAPAASVGRSHCPMRDALLWQHKGPDIQIPGLRAERLEGGYSDRLRAFRSLSDFELDSLILFKGAVTAALDLRVVDEDVFRAVVRCNESEPLLVVEPFHSALRHSYFSLFKWINNEKGFGFIAPDDGAK